jgi:hypothetical protein
MSPPSQPIALLRGLAGAAVGGALGLLAFVLLLKINVYSLVLPGTFMGLVCGWVSGRKSQALGIICAVATIVLSLFAQWRWIAPEGSLASFLTDLPDLRPATWLMLVLGVAMAYWFGIGRDSQPATEK